MYSPPELWHERFDLKWMYENVSAPFVKYIQPQEQLELFKMFGYYTVKPDPDSSMRIIALNTNICYINNFWLPYDPIDTNGQLQWLADTLDAAEKAEEEVLIIGHIQPGSGSCWPVWSNQFDRIINRYEGIIHGQWYGHSHEQYYTIAFENGTDRPISVAYVAGSGLTDGMNSGCKIYLYNYIMLNYIN
jgi:sphingomyelin phosphodiesterase